MGLHDDRTFVRHFSWVILALAASAIIFIIIAFVVVAVTGIDNHSGYSYVQYLKSHPGAAAPGSAARAQANNSGVAEKAAGTATAKAVAATGAAGKNLDGKAIWQAHCSACHATGVAGAPKIGDKSAWGPILAKTDRAMLYKHAIEGFKGERGFMPPKGGATNLSDAQVKAAVDYMVGESGGFSARAKATAAASRAKTAEAAGNKIAADGKAIWQAHCSVCHATGVAGAPKIGDKNAWGPILAKTSMDTLFDHAINGFHGDRGFMPPKGGAASLSDAQVRAAVKYMVDQSGGKSGG